MPPFERRHFGSDDPACAGAWPPEPGLTSGSLGARTASLNGAISGIGFLSESEPLTGFIEIEKDRLSNVDSGHIPLAHPIPQRAFAGPRFRLKKSFQQLVRVDQF